MENSITDLVNQLKAKCLDNDCKLLEQANITPGEHQFLVSSIGQKQLSVPFLMEKMQISQSRFSRIVEMMVNHGLLERSIDKKDRRAIKIKYTEKGRKIKKQIETYKQECEQKLMENISANELESIKETLNKLINYL